MPAKNGGYLSRDAILSKDDLRYEEIDVWDGMVRIRELTAMERNVLGAEFAVNKDKDGNVLIAPDLYPRIAAMVIVDHQGKRLFMDDDAEKLGEKGFAAIQKIVDAALKLSGMTEEGAREAGKESETPVADLPSA